MKGTSDLRHANEICHETKTQNLKGNTQLTTSHGEEELGEGSRNNSISEVKIHQHLSTLIYFLLTEAIVVFTNELEINQNACSDGE